MNAKDYFPTNPNTLYIYNCLGNDFFNFKRTVDYYDNDKFQLRFNNGKNEFINVYEYTPLGVNLAYFKNNTSHYENFLNCSVSNVNYLIKDPILEGNSWDLCNGSYRTITNTNIEVKTKFNLFKSAIEIITFTSDDEFSIDYYVPNIGLVKSAYYIKSIGLLYCELEEVFENTPSSNNIKIYYPDNNLNSIWFAEKNLNFYTNDTTSLVFSNEFKTPPKGLLPIITRNTIINKMYYDNKNNAALIDFSIDFFNDFKSNPKYFKLVLSSIYATLKDFYNTNNVSITINNTNFKYDLDKLQTNYEACQWKVSQSKLPLTYITKEKDTLLSISRKFDIPYEKIARLNNIKNPNKLSKNQVLQIYSSGIYTFKEQDTLNDICNNFGLTYESLIKINNITDISIIKPGVRLNLC